MGAIIRAKNEKTDIKERKHYFFFFKLSTIFRLFVIILSNDSDDFCF